MILNIIKKSNFFFKNIYNNKILEQEGLQLYFLK